jgi:hypothetical protein
VNNCEISTFKNYYLEIYESRNRSLEEKVVAHKPRYMAKIVEVGLLKGLAGTWA